jgi:hypothetical protein
MNYVVFDWFPLNAYTFKLNTINFNALHYSSFIILDDAPPLFGQIYPRGFSK